MPRSAFRAQQRAKSAGETASNWVNSLLPIAASLSFPAFFPPAGREFCVPGPPFFDSASSDRYSETTMLALRRGAATLLAPRSRFFSSVNSFSSFSASSLFSWRQRFSLGATGILQRQTATADIRNRFCGDFQVRTIVNRVKKAEDFQKVTDSEEDCSVKVVQFSASWCGPCRQVTPTIEGWSEKMPASEVQFFHVDIDECPELAEEYDISSVPTFLFFKNGKKVNTVVGGNTAKIEEAIKTSAN
ncbi:thioredoxin-like protein TLP1 [Toxoplasma gondii TgCatPRC2]|uniref:Thioredoxin-like protein TLP1 n=2 Tax=Toxoplasma gondii TaxID=5811 RepID=A0A151HNX8_TOXGO|nr:thioredoxin-like protein TLP1 [Toxoplasma gondii RUB]KYK71000.1 thioredoxin-like protein TLP1 [Toxoplasma gondii TgCatPRC2]